jgi:sucrose-6-phosphate hydrolase SacC (GH32 family)
MQTPKALSACTLCLSLAAAAAEDRPDILLADFEGEDYGAWTVEGEAFGKGPARGALPGQMEVGGYLGKGLVNSFAGGDGATGTLTSPEFTIERKRLNFLAGGGKHPEEVFLRLLVEGKPAAVATGANSERLRWRSWNVTDHEGKKARIEIVDRHTGGWGHINADHFVQSDVEPRVVDERDPALAAAARSVEKAAAGVAGDRTRPRYHFLPAANWMNDPNGPLHHDGWYHLFFQHNPYGDRWDRMHWGHARSRDLVRWERLPIALWPSRELGEEHCFSGCAALDAKGRPMLLYTSIGHEEPECWAAVPEDDELLRWRKHPANPLLRESSASAKLFEWRDPFFFRHQGHAYLVHGGNLNASKGGQAVVTLHRAEDGDLTRWSFAGILFTHPDPTVGNIECPNFFPLGDKWVLIVSPHRECDWFTGTFDAATGKFTAERRGKVDHSRSYYAPNGLEDPAGRRVLWGWVRDFKEGKGWNGCLTLPRVLALGKDGALLQEPIPALKALRGKRLTHPPFMLESAVRAVKEDHGDRTETRAIIEPRGAKRCGFRVGGTGEGAKVVTIAYQEGMLEVAGVRAPLPLAEGEKLDLRAFIDESVLEVYVNDGRECVTRVIDLGEGDVAITAFAEDGRADFHELDLWELDGIWPDAP